MITLAIIGIIYGALVAMVQPDVKRPLPIHPVSHMDSWCSACFRLQNWACKGALYQMLNHGVSTGALFLFVGFIYERRHTRMISDSVGWPRRCPGFQPFSS